MVKEAGQGQQSSLWRFITWIRFPSSGLSRDGEAAGALAELWPGSFGTGSTVKVLPWLAEQLSRKAMDSPNSSRTWEFVRNADSEA